MKAVVVSFSRVCRDPRVIRQLAWLRKQGFERILTVGLGPQPEDSDRHIELSVRPLLVRYLIYLFSYGRLRFHLLFGGQLNGLAKTVLHDADIIVVNEVEFLAWRVFDSNEVRETPTYLDIHEVHLGKTQLGFLEQLAFSRFEKWQVKKLKSFVSSRKTIQATTVEKTLADRYSEYLGIDVGVVLNAPAFRPVQIHEKAPSGTIRLVHHGMGMKGRGIEETMKALALLPRDFTLTLILFAPKRYLMKLWMLSSRLGIKERVSVLPGVPLNKLQETLSNFDISVVFLSGSSDALNLSLPNKFFESIHAGLALVTGPSFAMSALVKEYEMGVVARDWTIESLSAAILGLTPSRLEKLKEKSRIAARELSETQSEETFRDILKSLGFDSH